MVVQLEDVGETAMNDVVERDCYLGFLTDDGEVWEQETRVQFLQYEVREGREASETVLYPIAFIANRNRKCTIQ